MAWSWAPGENELLIKEPDKEYIITYNLGDPFPITVPHGTKIGARAVFNYELPSGYDKLALLVCFSGGQCLGFTESLPVSSPTGVMDMTVNPLYQNTITITENTNIEICVGYVTAPNTVTVVLCTNPLPIVVGGSPIELWHYNDYNFIREISSGTECKHPMIPPCEVVKNKNMLGYLYYLVSGVGSTQKDLKITLQKRRRDIVDSWHDVTYKIDYNIRNGERQMGFNFYGESGGYWDYRWKFQVRTSSSGAWEDFPSEQAYTLPITVRYIEAAECNPGEEDCRNNILYVCNSFGHWENTGEPCGTTECDPGETDCNGPNNTRRVCTESGTWLETGTPCEVCTPGESDCDGPGFTRRVCSASGQWVETGEPCCDPATEPYKCIDCELYQCLENQWVLNADPPTMDHIKYCGIQCNKTVMYGIFGGAALGLSALAIYMYNKRKKP